MDTDNTNKLDLQGRGYNALNDYFTEHQDEIVEIEILSPAIRPPDGVLMQDGLNIGVPKTVLALAFVRAKQLFFASVKVDRTSTVSCPQHYFSYY